MRTGHCGCLTALGVLLPLFLTLSALAQPLNREVEEIIHRSKLGAEARVGVYIQDLSNGVVLAATRAAEPFTPASNMKILTSGCALLVLGSDFVFTTELVRDGQTLIVRGSGDPALADPEILNQMEPRLTVDEVLNILAKAVASAGMTKATELIVDDRIFDREYVHPTWPKHQLSDWYCAEVSGLNFHTNVLSAWARPSPDGVGKRPIRSIQPDAPWLSVDNQARTVGEGKNAISLVRTTDANTFRLGGDVRFPIQEPVETTIHDPALFFGQVLADRLARAGVEIGDVTPAAAAVAAAPNPAVRLAAVGEALNEDRVLARITTPMADVLRRCNMDSHNLYAECLFKRMGRQINGDSGSWKSGAAVLRMMLSQKVGPLAARSTIIADGSGMSRDNAVTPETLVKWLGVMASAESGVRDAFIDSLATPGEGRMKDRFQGMRLKNEVRAKSGYIKGVRTLSGYITNTETGRRVAFSIMVNSASDDAGSQAKRFHEEIVAEADRWLSRQGAPARAAQGG